MKPETFTIRNIRRNARDAKEEKRLLDAYRFHVFCHGNTAKPVPIKSFTTQEEADKFAKKRDKHPNAIALGFTHSVVED